MVAIHTLVGKYEEGDIYNMDETGLYWRKLLDGGLSTQVTQGAKKDKSQISLVFCANGTGTDQMLLWIIGKAKTPQALRGVDIEIMGLIW